MLNELTSEQVIEMSLADLVCRMDQVREHAQKERYGADFQKIMAFPFPLVTQLIETSTVLAKDDVTKRRLADCAFRYLLQMDLLSVSAGISNKVVYGPEYSEERWQSPVHWMRAAVLDQYSIVASRIALECFFDVIFMVDTGRRMAGDSKFKEFKKWILKNDNPFIYFAGHIIKAFEFDRAHRQQEVHGTSRFARSLLTLHKPDNEESNIPLQLENVLLSVWHPLLEILNGKKPTSIAVFDSSDEFARRYFDSNSDPEAFSDFIRDLMAAKMTGTGQGAG